MRRPLTANSKRHLSCQLRETDRYRTSDSHFARYIHLNPQTHNPRLWFETVVIVPFRPPQVRGRAGFLPKQHCLLFPLFLLPHPLQVFSRSPLPLSSLINHCTACFSLRRSNCHELSTTSVCRSRLVFHFQHCRFLLFLHLRCSHRDRPVGYPSPQNQAVSMDVSSITYVPADLQYIQYEHGLEAEYLPAIRSLIAKDLSEPYSIYVYRYFLYQWGHLCFMVRVFPLT